MLIEVVIQGVSPLLCNRFTDAAMAASSSGTSAAIRGAKAAPREQADAKVYRDSRGKPIIPAPNMLSSLIDAGRFIKTGKSKLSTVRSSLVPAGLQIIEIELPITPGKFEVDSRAVVIPSTGGRIMAHRPRFDEWSLKFTLDVDDEMFGEPVIRELVDHAGKRVGLGDFRPSRKGPFGRFHVTQWKKK